MTNNAKRALVISLAASAAGLTAIIAGCSGQTQSSTPPALAPTASIETDLTRTSSAPYLTPVFTGSGSITQSPTAQEGTSPDPLDCILDAIGDVRGDYTVDPEQGPAQIHGVESIVAHTGKWYIHQAGKDVEIRRDITFKVKGTPEGLANLERYLNVTPLTATDKIFYRPDRNMVEVHFAVAPAKGGDATHPFVGRGIAKFLFNLGGKGSSTQISAYAQQFYIGLPQC